MAYAYKAKNDIESACAVLDQIPEIYFSRLSEKACILSGEDKWNAACKEEGQALYILMLMKDKIAECHTEKGNLKEALDEYEQAIGVIEIMRASDAWDEWRNHFKNRIEKIKNEIQ